MKDISKASKAGLFIMLIAGIIMAILVLANRQVPDLVAWIFFVGLAVAVVPAHSYLFIAFSTKSNLQKYDFFRVGIFSVKMPQIYQLFWCLVASSAVLRLFSELSG